jgi:hypothetical protein
MSREEMTKMLCNNGYSVEECNEMTYAEMCNACDVCKDMEMKQTYEAKKSAAQKKSKAKEMTYAQSGLKKPGLADRDKNKKISEWEKTVATNIEKNIKKQSAQDGQVQTFSQAQKAQAQKSKAQSQKPKTGKTTKRK